jgi:putative chitinase
VAVHASRCVCQSRFNHSSILLTMNRKIFFDHTRADLFSGSLSQTQVEGITAILDEWETRKLTDVRWLAYMLATTFHETARTMQPVEEWGRGKNMRYGIPDPATGKTYYGRGPVQVTWSWNYQRLTIDAAKEGHSWDFYHNPELLLKIAPGVWSMFHGMIHGIFTGKKLSDYFNSNPDPANVAPVNARRIINGLDRANLIAGYHLHFLNAIKTAS